jgi:hypothetical protein
MSRQKLILEIFCNILGGGSVLRFTVEVRHQRKLPEILTGIIGLEDFVEPLVGTNE